MKKTQFLTLFLTFVSLFVSVQSFSQVNGTGMGTLDPHPSAALDVVNTSAGILIPRMNVDQKNSIVSPASGLLIYDTTNKCISQNTGTPSVPTWVCLSAKDTQNSFFYMPSIAIDASVVTPVNQGGSHLDLYEVYKKQFSRPAAKSTDAPNSIPYFPKATDLYYYLIEYDESIFNLIGTSSIGTIEYKIIKASNYATFINVVFVLK